MLVNRKRKMSMSLATLSISRRIPQFTIPRPSLANIVLTFALIVVLVVDRPSIYSSPSLHQHHHPPFSEFHRAVLSAEPSSQNRQGKSRNDRVMKSSGFSDNSGELLESKIITRDKGNLELNAAARRARPLPPCSSDGSKAKTFIMVFMGHSGSSAMLSELRSHPEIYMEAMELVDHQETFNSTEALLIARQFFQKGVSLGKIAGFKIRPHHILAEPTEFRKLFKEFNTRVLWQYRQNLFKASVGEYAVRYLHDNRAIEGLRQNLSDHDRCKHPNGCSFRVENITYLHQTLKGKVFSHILISNAIHEVALSLDGEMQNSPPCIREIPYEDYLYDREETMRDIFRFLGLPWRITIPQRFKATGDNLCKVIENWDYVCRFFYPCIPWQHMLDDARNQCFCPTIAGPTKFCQVNDFR